MSASRDDRPRADADPADQPAAGQPTSPAGRAARPAVGRPLDDLWLWAPLPALAGVALLLRDRAPEVGMGGLMVLNFMHLAATWTRLYGEGRRRWPLSAFALPPLLIGICGLLVAAGHTPWLLLAVFLANIPHIGLQNFGLIRLAERARGAETAPLDRRLDQLYQALVPTWLAFWFATRPGADLFDSQAIGLDRLPEAAVLGAGAPAALIAFALWARLLQRALQGQTPGRIRVMLHLGWGPGAWACFALLPPELAAIPLAGAHYLQYLVIVRRFHRRGRRGRATAWGRLHPLAWPLALAVLAPGIPLLVSALLSPWISGADLALGAAASLHHFLVDGRIWKLRRPEVARALLA